MLCDYSDHTVTHLTPLKKILKWFRLKQACRICLHNEHNISSRSTVICIPLVLTVELCSLLMSCYTIERPIGKYITFTDSLSVVHALKKTSVHWPLVLTVRNTFHLYNKGHSLAVFLISGHVGIARNEVAAVTACDIVVSGIWKLKDILSSDLETHLHQSVPFFWPSEWDTIHKNGDNAKIISISQVRKCLPVFILDLRVRSLSCWLL
jgi:hypothetical protein